MESALALLCFAVASSLLREDKTSLKRVLPGAVFLALGRLARLDDTFLAGAIAFYILLRAPTGRRLRCALELSPIALALTAYCIYNWHTIGVVLPISGTTKAGFALWPNAKYLISLFLPVFTGDGPSVLLKNHPGYYGLGQRAARVTQMVLPALVCLLELALLARHPLTSRKVTLIHALAVGVISKAL